MQTNWQLNVGSFTIFPMFATQTTVHLENKYVTTGFQILITFFLVEIRVFGFFLLFFFLFFFFFCWPNGNRLIAPQNMKTNLVKMKYKVFSGSLVVPFPTSTIGSKCKITIIRGRTTRNECCRHRCLFIWTDWLIHSVFASSVFPFASMRFLSMLLSLSLSRFVVIHFTWPTCDETKSG